MKKKKEEYHAVGALSAICHERIRWTLLTNSITVFAQVTIATRGTALGRRWHQLSNNKFRLVALRMLIITTANGN